MSFVPLRRSCGCGSLRPPISIPLNQSALDQNSRIPPNTSINNNQNLQRESLNYNQDYSKYPDMMHHLSSQSNFYARSAMTQGIFQRTVLPGTEETPAKEVTPKPSITSTPPKPTITSTPPKLTVTSTPPKNLPQKQQESVGSANVNQKKKPVEVKPKVDVEPGVVKKVEVVPSFFFGNQGRIISASNSLTKGR